jgi:hypothetical protein
MHEEEEKFADLLKQSLRKQSMAPSNTGLQRDLWPRMLRHLDQSARHPHWLGEIFSPLALSSVPWFDWALLALLVLGICMFPRSIPIWLYHF